MNFWALTVRWPATSRWPWTPWPLVMGWPFTLTLHLFSSKVIGHLKVKCHDLKVKGHRVKVRGYNLKVVGVLKVKGHELESNWVTLHHCGSKRWGWCTLVGELRTAMLYPISIEEPKAVIRDVNSNHGVYSWKRNLV